jgi:hypothetical protein
MLWMIWFCSIQVGVSWSVQAVAWWLRYRTNLQLKAGWRKSQNDLKGSKAIHEAIWLKKGYFGDLTVDELNMAERQLNSTTCSVAGLFSCFGNFIASWWLGSQWCDEENPSKDRDSQRNILLCHIIQTSTCALISSKRSIQTAIINSIRSYLILGSANMVDHFVTLIVFQFLNVVRTDLSAVFSQH